MSVYVRQMLERVWNINIGDDPSETVSDQVVANNICVLNIELREN